MKSPNPVVRPLVAVPHALPEIPSPSIPLTRVEYFSRLLSYLTTATLFRLLTPAGYYRLARVWGTLEWVFDYKRRRRFATALRRIVQREPTPRERRRETRKYFMQSRCDKVFYLAICTLHPDKWRRFITIENSELLDEALGQGHGCYLCFGHYGSMQLFLTLLSAAGYQNLAVREKHESSLRRFVQDRIRNRYPDFKRTTWLFSQGSPRHLYRWLRGGGVMVSAMDVKPWHETQETEEVTIFGRRKRFVSGPIRIAAKCRSPILMGFITPGKNFEYRIDILGPLHDPQAQPDTPPNPGELMQTYADHLEKYLTAAPSLTSRI